MVKELEHIKAWIYYDENNDVFPITNQGEGGAIISRDNLDTAIEEFEEAMRLSICVKNLLLFKEDGFWIPKELEFTYEEFKILRYGH